MMQRCRGARDDRRAAATISTNASAALRFRAVLHLLAFAEDILCGIDTYSDVCVRSWRTKRRREPLGWCRQTASYSVPRSLARRAGLSSLPAYCSCDHVAANAAGMPPFQNILCADGALPPVPGKLSSDSCKGRVQSKSKSGEAQVRRSRALLPPKTTIPSPARWASSHGYPKIIRKNGPHHRATRVRQPLDGSLRPRLRWHGEKSEHWPWHRRRPAEGSAAAPTTTDVAGEDTQVRRCEDSDHLLQWNKVGAGRETTSALNSWPVSHHMPRANHGATDPPSPRQSPPPAVRQLQRPRTMDRAPPPPESGACHTHYLRRRRCCSRCVRGAVVVTLGHASY
jgi:hypothetical protein